MRGYVSDTRELVRDLQQLEYASHFGGKDIRDQEVNPENNMNPWEEVNKCTITLKTCIKALELDIEAHKDTIQNQTTVEKVKDFANDMWEGGKAGFKVLFNQANAQTEARKMANMTHTGKGKYNLVRGLSSKNSELEYGNLVERDELFIKKAKELMNKYDPQE